MSGPTPSPKQEYQCPGCPLKIRGQAAAILHRDREHPDSSLGPIEHGGVSLMQIPHNPKVPGLATPGPTSHAPIIDHAGRKMVVAKYHDVQVPFYLSSGKAGKDSENVHPEDRVAAGKWYPFFGIGSDGWINKGNSDQINHHYGSPELEHIAKTLDEHIGDVRDDTSHPVVDHSYRAPGSEHQHVSFINSTMPNEPAIHPNYEDVPKFRDQAIEGKETRKQNMWHIIRALKNSRMRSA